MKRVIVLPALFVVLSACGGGDPAPADSTAEDTSAVAEAEEQVAAKADHPSEEAAGDAAVEAGTEGVVAAAAPPASFTQCRVCHTVEPGKNGIGPSLVGVFGATAGHEPSFAYSTAMKESGKVWNEANLDAYLENPRSYMPGNKMSFAGLRDPAKRKEVIDYLKTL
jgi:cytochrome c2